MVIAAAEGAPLKRPRPLKVAPNAVLDNGDALTGAAASDGHPFGLISRSNSSSVFRRCFLLALGMMR